MWDGPFFLDIVLSLLACATLVCAIRAFRRGRPRTWQRRLGAAGIIATSLAVGFGVRQLTLLVSHEFGDGELAEWQSRRLAMAMHIYLHEHGRLPPAFHPNRQGRPLLSWRVLLLPYIEHKPLYDQFHLEEPWDSPHNLTLIKKMPLEYLAPKWGVQPGPSFTYWHAFTGEATAFVGAEGLQLPGDFPDGPQNTVLLALGGPAVLWTKPDDIIYGPGIPLPNLYNVLAHGFYVAMGDASVRLVRRGVSEETIRAAITRNGGEKLDPLWWSH